MVKAEKQATQTQPLIHDPAEETSGAQANKLTISKVRAHQQEAYGMQRNHIRRRHRKY